MATYYVSSSYTGSVSNGSQLNPWKTLSQVQSGMSSFKAGDNILFKCGDTFSGTLNITKSGALNSPITFGSYGDGNRPKFTGTNAKIAVLFSLYSKSYVTFENLWIIDEGISVSDRTIESRIQRAWVIDNSNNIIIRNSIIDRVGVGIYMTGLNGGYNIIENSDIGNMRMVVNDTNPDNDYGANPVVISSSNNIVRNNYFHDCWAQSIDYTLDGGAVELYEEGVPVNNNIISGNTFYDCNGVGEFGGRGGIIDNNIFAYNKCIWNGSGFYVNNSGNFAVNVTNLKIYNNIFIEHKVWRLPEDNSSFAYVAFKSTPTKANTLFFSNNVVELYGYMDVFRNQWSTAGTLIESNNVYKRNTLTSGTLLNISISPSSIDQPTTKYFVNTTDSNPLNWDYTPLPNSILINSGKNVDFTKDFLGNQINGNPEIGIIEYQSLINQPSQLGIVLTYTPINVFGGTSTVTVSATGGTQPYLGTGTFIKSAGQYTFTVSDANGKSASSTINIVQPDQLVLNTSFTPITTINGKTNVQLNASGGIKPYSYSRDNVNFSLNNIFSGLTAGTYVFYVKDASNSVATTSLTLTQPTSTFVINGLTIRTKNGATPLSYNIDDGLYTTNATFSNLVAGKTYTIRAKDGQGVIRTMTVTIQ